MIRTCNWLLSKRLQRMYLYSFELMSLCSTSKLTLINTLSKLHDLEQWACAIYDPIRSRAYIHCTCTCLIEDNYVWQHVMASSQGLLVSLSLLIVSARLSIMESCLVVLIANWLTGYVWSFFLQDVYIARSSKLCNIVF